MALLGVVLLHLKKFFYIFKVCPCFPVTGCKIIVFQNLALSLDRYSVSACEGSSG